MRAEAVQRQGVRSACDERRDGRRFALASVEREGVTVGEDDAGDPIGVLEGDRPDDGGPE